MNEYRASHSSPGYGLRYLGTYSSGYYAALWEQVEKPMLQALLPRDEFVKESALDFACGTGRITNLLADYFPEVVGVDVSASMLEVARSRPNILYRQTDITKVKLRQEFWVATAFRFFLNAEPNLRLQAAASLYSALQPGGYLLTNIHMVDTSPMGRLYRALHLVGIRRCHQTLSRSAMRNLLEEAGFTIEQEFSYGYMPRLGRFLPYVGEKLVSPIEILARALRFPDSMAHNVIFIARRPA